MNPHNLLSRIKVIANATVTWLTFIGVVLTIIADEVGDLWPGETGDSVITFLWRITVWIATATTIIRRVTPVAPDEYGVLPHSS